jgi:hypothetical protein
VDLLALDRLDDRAMGLPMVTLTPAPLALLFHELIGRRGGAPARRWLEEARATVGPPLDHDAFTAAFVTAARRIGKAPLEPSPEEASRLAALGITWPVSGWRVDELGRAALFLIAAGRLPARDLPELLEECYSRGDNRERQAVLRALPLLPEPERFLAIGVDACRTHIQPLFEAIACENPYPAAYFPDLNFNQMVLKALFIGVALERIVGLGGRVTPELGRMAGDYASERRAAGRSVPPDIWRVTGEQRSEP